MNAHDLKQMGPKKGGKKKKDDGGEAGGGAETADQAWRL